jgi:NAD(P) transhydrogenase subunit alpha
MVRDMRSGSVIVDLAAEAGGNCELSVPGENRTVCGVSILAPLNVPSTVPVHASQMYARNVLSVIKLVVKEGALIINRDDEIIRSACLTVPAEAATS